MVAATIWDALGVVPRPEMKERSSFSTPRGKRCR
jgi:hypothetical protein